MADPASTTEASSPRRRLTKAERRAQLLAAAEAVFAERGLVGTTFEDIALRAEVTRPLLYGHFESVEELYLECHRVAREEMQQTVIAAAVGAGTEPRDQLAAGLGAYFRFVHERPARWDLLYGPGAAAGPLAPQTAELRFATAEQIAALFFTAAPQLPHDEAVAYAHIVSGGAEQLAKWWQRHPEVAVEEVLQRMMDAVWEGIAAMLRRAAR